MNKSSFLGLGAGVLAFAIGVCLSSAGKAQEVPDPSKLPAITAMTFHDIALGGDLIYQAKDEALKAVSMLDVRFMDIAVCFKNYADPDVPPAGYIASNGNSIQELFDKYSNDKVRTILHIERIYADDPATEPSDCSTFEYAYVQSDAAPAPEPAKKKK